MAGFEISTGGLRSELESVKNQLSKVEVDRKEAESKADMWEVCQPVCERTIESKICMCVVTSYVCGYVYTVYVCTCVCMPIRMCLGMCVNVYSMFVGTYV